LAQIFQIIIDIIYFIISLIFSIILLIVLYSLFLHIYYSKAQLEKEAMEETRYRELLEQERRDHELAVRLAQESNGQVEDSPPPARK